jgi:hypothetical protein
LKFRIRRSFAEVRDLIASSIAIEHFDLIFGRFAGQRRVRGVIIGRAGLGMLSAPDSSAGEKRNERR